MTEALSPPAAPDKTLTESTRGESVPPSHAPQLHLDEALMARIGAAASGALFTNILPPLDWMHISGSSDLDPTVPYGAVAALVICIIAFLPIIAELRATRKESLMHGVVEEPSKDEPFTIAIRGMSFPIALLLLAACWVLLLGV